MSPPINYGLVPNEHDATEPALALLPSETQADGPVVPLTTPISYRLRQFLLPPAIVHDAEFADASAGLPSPPPPRLLVVVPIFSILLVLLSCVVFSVCDVSTCSQPLGAWILLYTGRQVFKSVLYGLRTRFVVSATPIPQRLLWLMVTADLANPIVWTLGGYYIFHTETCSSGLYTYACLLWGIQSVTILLPCCFVSTIIFCAPCLLWLAPYIVRPDPNTIATGREVMAKIPPVQFSDLPNPLNNTSCTICLSEYVADDEVRQLPCGHIFHSGCIESWLGISQLCPVDRTNVVTMLADTDTPLETA